MKFSEISVVLDQMSKTTKRLELTDILVSLFRSADSDLKPLVYLVEGKLAPDYEGIETGMSDKLIIKALSTVSNIDENTLMNDYSKIGDIGIFASMISSKKKLNSLTSVELTVDYVYRSLISMAKASGSGSTKTRLNIYIDLLLNGTEKDILYITRIITGKLRIGVSDATILDALISAFSDKKYSEDIENAYNFHPDLGYIAEELRNGRAGKLANEGAVPMIPFKVMLAERLRSIPEIIDKMENNCAFEYKYDGMRTEIHKDGEKVKLFSRGNEETTNQFPDIVKACLDTFKEHSMILDGETVPYNPETGELYPFQIISQRRGRKYNLNEKSSEIPVTVFIFDIVYLDGKDLSKTPYVERRKILESLFSETDTFKLAKRIVSSNKEEIKKFFDQAIEDGCEGLVAKNTSNESVYQAGARGWLWIKIKRDYEAQLWDSLDLTVVGAFNGHGRRKGTYGALLLATYNDSNDTFETVCKLGSGFTDDVLFSLPKKFQSLISDHTPPRVNSKIIPDYWIIPEIVMQIVGAEITVSPVHTCAFGIIENDAGLSVRFPRFSGIWRNDKNPEDSTTTKEILEMYREQKKTIDSDNNIS
ncbi:MAG: ATP-dependent DNA ligase [Thermoplasmata archaeon]